MTSVHAPVEITLDSCPSGSLGLGTATPVIAWQVPKAPSGWEQTAADLELARRGGLETAHVDGSNQTHVAWPFAPLQSREEVQLRVRVHGKDHSSRWSQAAEFEAGLLKASDWTAKMVGPSQTIGPSQTRGSSATDSANHEAIAAEGKGLRRPSLVRSDFLVADQMPVKARLFLTAHGLIKAEINGTTVGDDELVPDWTVYDQRLRYRVYDVTSLIRPGSNGIGAWLADGWYRGRIGFLGGTQDIYGHDLSALMQLELTDAQGYITTVSTDENWTAGPGPILHTGLHEGEAYDARQYPVGWSNAGFTDPLFSKVQIYSQPPLDLYSPNVPPVRCTGEIQPQVIEPLGDGKYLLDFGQNASGRLRLKINAPRGTTITIKHAEVLEDAVLGTRALRHAQATDRYICAGRGPVTWEPRFTIHGFRYAQIEGWPEGQEIKPSDAVFRVLQTDAPRIGWFSCSNPGITKLHQNIVWSTRSNFVSIPTDCPQRDERLGWTGDLQVFAPSALFLYRLGPMISDWLRDVEIEQMRRGGAVPVFVPKIPGHYWDDKNSIAIWGDVTVLTPWQIYLSTGDKAVLCQQLASATAWVDHIHAQANPSGIWNQGVQLGDWLDPTAPPDDPTQAQTDPYLVASAYLVHSTFILGKILEVLGHAAKAQERFTQAQTYKRAFQREYVTSSGLLTSDTQTAYALAIAFNLLETPDRQRAGDRLAALVRNAEGKISTGFAGTPIICEALEASGHNQEAYLLVENDSMPSWLYTVNMGATTTWERWDAMLPDGTINPGEMTSFNHYALGAVANWLHTTVGGLRPTAPGYRTFEIAPKPGGSVRWARATHETPYGLASVQWVLKEATLTISGAVPVGAKAVLRLPGHEDELLAHGEFSREVAI